jgi:hypothetical protein
MHKVVIADHGIGRAEQLEGFGMEDADPGPAQDLQRSSMNDAALFCAEHGKEGFGYIIAHGKPPI